MDEAASIAPSIQKSRVSRGLGSRFGSLFSSKSGHVNDPQIELQEPHRVYARGDVVKGKVILAVAKSLGITHLTVSLFGYVEVFKHHSRNKAGLRVNPVRVASEKGKRWVTEYYGDGFASLFEHEATLCGEGRLDPNSYHFQFEMPFPSDRELPTSIEVNISSPAAYTYRANIFSVRARSGCIWRCCYINSASHNQSHHHHQSPG